MSRKLRWTGVTVAVAALTLTVIPATQMAAAQPTRIASPRPATQVAGPATATKQTGPIILDNDIGELDDSAQSMLMLLQAHANLLGVSEEGGNTWQEEGLAYALSQEELIGRHVPVYRGTDTPLSGNRQKELPLEEKLYGPSQYIGSWARPRPPSYLDLPHPPYGGYPKGKPAKGAAANFIIREVRKYPHQVTIMAAGALTNVALAIRQDPGIVPLVKRIVYMCCAIDVPGNTTPAAEFNIWYDPDAAKIVLNAPWKNQVMVPLDLTNQVSYGKRQYDRIVAGRPTPIKREFKALQGPTFRKNPHYSTYIYDTIASAIILDPSLIKKVTTEYVDVDTDFGLDYGRTLGYPGSAGPAGAKRVHVVTAIDIPRFFNLYIREFRKP